MAASARKISCLTAKICVGCMEKLRNPKREKGNGRANGTYKLNLKLCNPEGKC